MRILHLSNHIQNVGNGIVNVAVDLACLQAKEGLQVAIASQGGEYEILLEKYGISHFQLDQSRTVTKLIKAVYSYRDIIKKFQPHIVHCHMMTGVLLAGIFRNNQEYGLVATVHNEFQRSAILMGLADRVIAVSHAVANSMISRGIPSHKLRVVANGTFGSPRHKKIQEYQPMKLHRPAITTVAGMYTRKGISELIQAFQLIAQDFPQAHLYIVGEGPDRTMFEAMVQKCGELKHRIHFEGFQPEPQRYMLSTDIFVLASHREPFGLVLTEARETGCAIVATDVDGIPETLDYGEAGILVPPQDSQSLAYALIQLLSDRQKLQDWKLRGQKNLQRFSTTRMTEETLNIYSELRNKHHVFSSTNTR